MGFRASIPARSRFFYVLKLGDLDDSLRELGGDFQFSAQGFDKVLKRAGCPIIARSLRKGGIPQSRMIGENSLTRCR